MFGFLAACNPEPTMTPLEIQNLQTRKFSASYNTTFASTISVFQDLGYTVTNANKDTGLISAQSASKNSVAYLVLTGDSLNVQTAATAFIERVKGKSVIRLNFVRRNRTSSVFGQSTADDIPILDAVIYQNAFEKIENAIFLRQ